MRIKIVLFHRSKEASEQLARDMIPFFRRRPGGAEFFFYTPQEVFDRALPDDAHIAFFTLCDAQEEEALEEVSARYRGVPLVLIGKDERLTGRAGGHCHVLHCPVEQEDLRRTLSLCVQRAKQIRT